MRDPYKHQGPATGIYPEPETDHTGRRDFWLGLLIGYPAGILMGVLFMLRVSFMSD